MSFHKMILATAALAMLAACGGGGSSDNSANSSASPAASSAASAAANTVNTVATAAASAAGNAMQQAGGAMASAGNAMQNAGSAMSANAMAPIPPTLKCADGVAIVWVNTKTKKYHLKGDAEYGKTKKGEYMCETDATAKGFTKAKS